MEPGAAAVRPDLESNVADHVSVRKADADGSLTVWTGNQGSYSYRSMIAASLALPEERVRVVLTACGGGFGGKEEPTVQIHAALGSLKTGRPVKMVLTREESFRMSVKRHPKRIHMRHAFSRDGRILAVSSRVVADAGAYLSLTKPVVFRSAVTAPGPYRVDAVEADSCGVFTHRTPGGVRPGDRSGPASPAQRIRGRLAHRDGPASRRDGTGYLKTLDAAMEGMAALRREFVAGDTARRPDGGMTTASRQTFVTGNAVAKACDGVRPLLDRYLPAASRPDPGETDRDAVDRWTAALARAAESGRRDGVEIGCSETDSCLVTDTLAKLGVPRFGEAQPSRAGDQ